MANSPFTRRYLLLLRHAQHNDGHLTDQGSVHVRSLAMRFSDWIQGEWRIQPERTVRLWFTSASSEVQETADLFTRDVLAHVRPGEGLVEAYPFARTIPGASGAAKIGNGRKAWMPALVPSSLSEARDLGQVLSAYSPDETAFRYLRKWLEATETGEQQARRAESDVPLLVGNDPLIGWLASSLTRRDTPVARGELVCLFKEGRAGTRWRLLWTISEDAETEAEAIRTKIKSKMNTATGLGAVIVGLTTFLLQNSLQREPSLEQWLAFAALATSAGFYFATLFLYDTLQMPPRFWSSRFPSRSGKPGPLQAISARLRHGHPTVERPPSSTARVLQAGMVQVWIWIFTPATVLAGAGVACLALGASADSDPMALRPWQVLSAIVVLATVAGLWVAWQRPNLGASD